MPMGSPKPSEYDSQPASPTAIDVVGTRVFAMQVLVSVVLFFTGIGVLLMKGPFSDPVLFGLAAMWVRDVAEYWLNRR